MSKKNKTPKFTSVLEDFRKFAGLKVAEEQGDKETGVSYIPSEEYVKKQLPAGGKPFGSNTDPNANKGTDVNEKAPDAKEPSTEEQSTKEVSASSKVASEDEELVNSLLNSISIVVSEDKVAAEVKEETKTEGKEVPVSAKPDMADENKKEAAVEAPVAEVIAAVEPKVASENEINEDVLASKIASHFRNVSVGYELGKFLFQTLGQKVAEEMPPEEGVPAEAGVPVEEAAGMEAAGAPVEGGGEGDEVAMILQAVQELVAEGQITEEQAQQFLTELQSAVEGGGAEGGAPEGGAPVAPEGGAPVAPEGGAPASEEPAPESEEEEKPAEDKEAAAIEIAVNAKVAELVSEGKNDAEIQEYLKTAAAADADVIIKTAINNQIIKDFVYEKVAHAIENGATDEQVNEYIKYANENEAAVIEEINQIVQVQNAVQEKVAALKAEGKTEAEIEEYLKTAAVNDAAAIQENTLKNAILSKVAELRDQKKVAEAPVPLVGPEGAAPAGPEAGGEGQIPPEVQQILEALEKLLQSGQITEEEAMQVLQELGIGGGAEEGAPAQAPVVA